MISKLVFFNILSDILGVESTYLRVAEAEKHSFKPTAKAEDLAWLSCHLKLHTHKLLPMGSNLYLYLAETEVSLLPKELAFLQKGLEQ